jgi:D-lyxose ketol-isomerase
VTDAVDGFARGWNAHPISTENKFLTYNQLFVFGLLQLTNSGFMHEELNQSNVVNKMAEREAQIMAEKSYSNRRVQVPPSHLHCLKRNLTTCKLISTRL